MENNKLDSYLVPESPSQSPIEYILIEKNRLIEEYKTFIEQLTLQYKEQTINHSNNVSYYKLKLESLQKKCDAITQGEIYELLQYYENEITKINQQNKNHSDIFKTQIATLTSTIPDQVKLKKVISTLMNENSSLKESNNTLWKISRMNEAYKIVARKYEIIIEEKKKMFSAHEKDQLQKISLLTNDSKHLKDQIIEDKKTIKNLMNTIELMKTNSNNKDSNKKFFSSNVWPSNDNSKRFFTEYEEKKTEIELLNIKLNKSLNGSKMIISEKTEIVKLSLEKIMNRILKDNSAYKGIIKKDLMTIQNCFDLIHQESINLLKKANSSYNAYELSRNLLKELIIEYESKTKKKTRLNSHNIHNSNDNTSCFSNRSSEHISLSKDINDTIFNSIELAKKYLNTFE